MSTISATITSKGQITIPKDIRRYLGLESGDKISFIVSDEGFVTFIPVTKNVAGLRGIIGKPESPVSIDDMNATIKARGGTA